jgi:hypothetical protein
VKPPAGLEHLILRESMGPVDWSPPTDLDRVAHSLGVERIEYAEHLLEGCVQWELGVPRIFIDSSLGLTRQRFTLAHELAHVMINSTGDHHALRHLAGSDFELDEERLCDRIASVLLAPDPWVRRLQRAQLDLRLLLACAETAKVSLTMLFTRLDEVGGDDCFLRWSRRDGEWLLAQRAGYLHALRDSVTMTAETQRTLDRQKLGFGEITVGLDTKAHRLTSNAQVLVRKDHCLMLLRRKECLASPHRTDESHPGYRAKDS